MYLNYTEALNRIKLFAKQAPWHLQFNVLAVALEENLAGEALFGATEQSRHDRYQLIYRLDQLFATNNLTFTFSELCRDSSKQITLDAFSKKNQRDDMLSAGTQEIRKGTCWAVLVGINRYQNTGSYGQLTVCVQDAMSLAQQLQLVGFDTHHIRLLTDNDVTLLPLRENILTALHVVASATEPDDLLLFYFSGHGLPEKGESYLIPSNATDAVAHTAIAISSIKEIMLSAQAKDRVIILDACHSGVRLDAKGKFFMNDAFINDVFSDSEGIATFSSCQSGQLSYEWPDKQSSVFTHYLVQALQGEARQEQKEFITVTDVNYYVTHGVKRWAVSHQVSQVPRLNYIVSGEIVLVDYRARNETSMQDNPSAQPNPLDEIEYQDSSHVKPLFPTNVHQELAKRLSDEQGIRIRTPDTSSEDLIERYHSVPLHALLLYTGEDHVIADYLKNHWSELEGLTSDICDIYPIVKQFTDPQDANAYTFMKDLDVLREAHFQDYDQLPVLFFWDQWKKTAYISFGDNPDISSIRRILRHLFGALHQEPTIATISRIKNNVQQSEQPFPSRQISDQKSDNSIKEPDVSEQRLNLYQILQNYADDLELKEICLEIDVPYNRLDGDSVAARAFSLTTKMYNYKRLGELEKVLRTRFPNRFA